MKVRQLKYRHHASGQAFVRIRGKDFYLGKYGTPESKEAYCRIIHEYLARKQQLPAKTLVGGPLVNEVSRPATAASLARAMRLDRSSSF